MAKNLRVVVDTNVLISGLFGISDSPSSYILGAFRDQKITLVTTPLILEEVADVINRKRIVKLTKMSISDRKNFMEGLIERSDVTKGRQLKMAVGRDVKDDKLLACALEANANYIVTGDSDLLTLKEYEGIKIVKPREFMDILEQ